MTEQSANIGGIKANPMKIPPRPPFGEVGDIPEAAFDLFKDSALPIEETAHALALLSGSMDSATEAARHLSASLVDLKTPPLPAIPEETFARTLTLTGLEVDLTPLIDFDALPDHTPPTSVEGTAKGLEDLCDLNERYYEVNGFFPDRIDYCDPTTHRPMTLIRDQSISRWDYPKGDALKDLRATLESIGRTPCLHPEPMPESRLKYYRQHWPHYFRYEDELPDT